MKVDKQEICSKCKLWYSFHRKDALYKILPITVNLYGEFT